jgi:hypothetical protein
MYRTFPKANDFREAFKGRFFAPQCQENQPWRNWLIKPVQISLGNRQHLQLVCASIQRYLLDIKKCGPYQLLWEVTLEVHDHAIVSADKCPTLVE